MFVNYFPPNRRLNHIWAILTIEVGKKGLFLISSTQKLLSVRFIDILSSTHPLTISFQSHVRPILNEADELFYYLLYLLVLHACAFIATAR